MATSGSLVHLTPDGTILAQITPLASGVTVLPYQGAAWVTYASPTTFAPPPGVRTGPTPDVVHYAGDGTELARYLGAWVLGFNPATGALWFASAGDVVQISPSDQELHRLSGLDSVFGFDPRDDTLWAQTGETQQHPLLQHVTPAGEVLWQDPLVAFTQVPGSSYWVDPDDGSCWVADFDSGFRAEYVHLSPSGTELERRSLSDDFLEPTTMCISPYDGTWWVVASDLMSDDRILLHLSAAGAELGRHVGVGAMLAVDPADGSVWTGEHTSGTVIATHLHHFAANAGLVWEGTTVGWAHCFAVDRSDGSLWIPTDSGGFGAASLQRLSPTGALLGTLPRTETLDALLWLAVNPTDGSLYLATAQPGIGSVVTRISHEGVVQWTDPDFITASNLVLDETDGSVWVTDTGSQGSLPRGAGSALVHLAADGTELWRNESYVPRSMALDPRDGSLWLADPCLQIVHLGLRPLFPDVTGRNWAYDAIAGCVSAGIVGGYPDGLYHPGLVVTRDQMAVFIARALAGSDAAVPSGPATPTFPDVPASGDGSWAYEYIEYCVSEHIVGGYPDGNYWPLIELDRGQMAVFIARAMVGGEAHVPTAPATATFADVDTGFWAFPHVEYLASEGIVHGYWDALYHPEYLCTREQMAAFIARSFALP